MEAAEVKALQGLIAQPLVDDRPPLTSPVTLQVAFALAVGYQWLSSRSFVDTVEELKDGRTARQVTWSFEGSKLIRFANDEWAVREFVEHLIDGTWARDHRSHPVAKLNLYYSPAAGEKASARADFLERATTRGGTGPVEEWVRAAAENYRGYRWKLRAGLDGVKEPHPVYKDPLIRHLLVRRGERRAYIPLEASPEERAAELRRFGMS